MRPVNAIYQKANEESMSSYQQSKEAIMSIMKEGLSKPKEDFFQRTGAFLVMMMDHYDQLQEDAYFEQSFEVLKANNEKLYSDILEPNYQTSYVRPTYAVSKLGKDLGQFLSAVAYILRQYVGLVYEGRIFSMNHMNELYLLVYEAVVQKGIEDVEELKDLVRDHHLENLDKFVELDWLRRVSPMFDTYSHIADTYDLTDLRYLFRYGLYVDRNEIETAKHILSLPEETTQKIADTYTEAFVRGFVRNDIPLDHKESVLVTFHLGFEKFVKKAYRNFEKLGLKPFSFYHLRGVQRPRLYNTRPNKQMEYDHRFSDAILINEAYADAMIAALAKAMKTFEKEEHVYAGPALFEIFGEVAFNPINSDDNMVYDEVTTKLDTRIKREMGTEYSKYVPGDAYSFTINDYPLPSIGKDYKEIFDATIAVNTLDEPLYEKIQEVMIDALDQSDYVEVKGEDDNETDLRVALAVITDPDKETKFDNCTADVNVPVGEVYTSPVLKGTNGLLHVKEIYLTGQKYIDLKIWFEDGMITEYDCKNFETDEENKKFVREMLLHPHTTLPLGEFAIGTNTVAYMMAKKFDISSQLPILIGEKTGPHFAIGDTCFTWAEDSPVYNSNGKEVIARENEKTCQRKTNVEEAYTYRHTDITIPYNELDTIIGYNKDGEAFEIIRGGRFVLEGTEALNEPFDE